MGGTFDPVHHGHLSAASEVAARFALDEVVFVPTGRPWQKSDTSVSPAEDRYLMTVIATASNPQFSVSRIEVDRPGATYTIDTLTDLRRQRPDAELFFITGADALAQIVSWRDNQQLFELAHFIGVTRPGFHLADAHLPDTGVGLERERLLAPLYVRAAGYGTRCSTVLRVAASGRVRVVERTWPSGEPAGWVERAIEFRLD